jgi:hypothetical protein
MTIDLHQRLSSGGARPYIAFRTCRLAVIWTDRPNFAFVPNREIGAVLVDEFTSQFVIS